MNPVLKLLIEDGHLTTAQIAQVAGLSDAEVDQHLEQLKKDKIFLGWRPVLDLSRETAGAVRGRHRGENHARTRRRVQPAGGAHQPVRRGRIVLFMSGAYDLLIFATGPSLQKVASFVSEKLAPIEGVVSTSTHFMLRSYKEGGFQIDLPSEPTGRLKVAP